MPLNSIGNLSKLRTLSLRSNSLSGILPSDLGSCTVLRILNLENNNFSGAIPTSIYNLKNLVRVSFSGNRFSGEISEGFNNLMRIIHRSNKSSRQVNVSPVSPVKPLENQHSTLIVAENHDDIEKAPAEVLGKGFTGTTYKAYLDRDVEVIVKRLKNVCVSEEEFRGKVEEVGAIGHGNRNLVPLRAYYYGRDEKLMVYESMPTNLSAVLHGERVSKEALTWVIRSRIALGVATADVYSFGTVLLELLTGTNLSTVINDERIDLPKWVKSIVEERLIIQVFDPVLIRFQNSEEQMAPLLHLAISCTSRDPERRPPMADITRRIKEIFRGGSEFLAEVGIVGFVVTGTSGFLLRIHGDTFAKKEGR
ncbi:hypothetical protein HAX54_029140 [Datura stramonium]|uniref:Protein kinase domain-containing protein n=1 Tax=Datura stramonium TaxID=4076 RepID=A0ABS8V7H4_DATST|nr:hypothetical protein [Datura stramonium]